MANGYYNHGNLPGDNTPGSSAEIRAEFDAVTDGFNKIAPVTGNANKVVVINAAETGQTVKAADALVADTTHAATGKTTPVDADELPISDSAASYGLKKVTFSNLGAWVWSKLGALIAAGTAKTTPVGADSIAISDSAAAGATKQITFTNMLNWFAAKAGNASNVFSVAAATDAAHAVRSDQISTDNTNFPIYTPPATWTPIDASGAGLTFTSVTGYITKIGKLRIARFALTFPVTADGSFVSIGGLPEAAASHGPNSIQGFFTSTSTITSRGCYGAGGSSAVSIDKNNGSAVAINSDFSGCVLYATLFYEVA